MSTSLLNKTQLRDFTFECVRKRPGLATKMTRISDDFYEWAETQLRVHVYNDVRVADKSIKTLRPPADAVRPDGLPWLVNQSGLHEFATAALNGGGLTQVAGDYLDSCDLFLRRIVSSHIATIPSAGRTIR
jgi:hypothetical protein